MWEIEDMEDSFGLPDSLAHKYDLLEILNESRQGITYKVRHRIFGVVRVAKVMRAHHIDDENLQLRYRRMARLGLKLRHPHIARFYDFTIDGGNASFVREFIEGRTLGQIIEDKGPPNLDLTLLMAVQSLAALEHIHEQGYVHREISPESLMLTWDVEGMPFVKLVDLGLAKRLSGGEDLTATDVFMGLAKYSAPELFSESAPDRRSDLYSFGVVLYELLTGQHPIDGRNFGDFFRGHLSRPPRDFAETDPEGRIPLGLRRILLQSLEKNAADRMAAAKDFAQLIEPFRGPISNEMAAEL